jgi:hypothetical protein
MERFWRTLREGCLDFLGPLTSLHHVNVRLWAFLDEHYHKAAHASLLGRSPARVYDTAERPVDSFDESKLRDALTVRVRRRVRRDSTLPLDGDDWELDQGFLAGRLVTVARCLGTRGISGPCPAESLPSTLRHSRVPGPCGPCRERGGVDPSSAQTRAQKRSDTPPVSPSPACADKIQGWTTACGIPGLAAQRACATPRPGCCERRERSQRPASPKFAARPTPTRRQWPA